jgi:cellulose synthase/poly-beta-1,6-N-acetylglucosamine synthase-like glycosyltransferase
MAILGYRKLKYMFLSLINKSLTSSTDNHQPTTYMPTVSFIITAFNEETRIGDKILNSLDFDYPKDKIEFIVASDCSVDKTDDIVKSYATSGFNLVRAPERKGKENAQKYAVDASKGEILVFSDVATILEPDAITNIVTNFRNPKVGCISSEDKFIDKDGNISGEGAYVKYEMYLRRMETKVNSLVGLSGSFFAARKKVCLNWETDIQSDFNTLLNSVKIGLKGVSDPKSIGYYHNIADEKKEFQRKIRTVLRGITVLMRSRALLNIFKYGMFSWQLFSHKLCRWLVPLFMILAFFANIFIAGDSEILAVAMVFQISFYLSAAYYYFFRVKKDQFSPSIQNSKSKILNYLLSLIRLCYFFLTVNCSIFIAWINYLKGQRATFWEPSKR